jgi:hypothetical protein
MEDLDNRPQLTSWKAIASYLGRDIRTCLRWEKNLGLPIHRIDPESPKSRVYAFQAELDEWLRQTNLNKIAKQKKPLRSGFWKKILSFGILVLVIAAGLIVIFLKKYLGSSEPADFHIAGSTLVILNEKGKELWHYDTGLENLAEENSYRANFQFKRTNDYAVGHQLPNLMIKDMNSDGKIEVLFSTQTKDEMGEGELICFNDRGTELWRFKAGREMTFGSMVYSDDYRICGFDTCDIDQDGSLEIFVSSLQNPHWPTQLVSLSSRGQVLGEYWNSGHLSEFTFLDLDRDGKMEIIFSGLNNEYQKGCLVVFEVDNIQGSSPQMEDEFTCPALGRGSEKFYILFPRTDVDLIAHPVEAICRIDILKNRHLSLSTAISKIIFILSPDLSLENVVFSHGFMQLHKEGVRAGKIKSILDEKYRENLMRGILYYDGQGWLSTPTPLRVPGAQ